MDGIMSNDHCSVPISGSEMGLLARGRMGNMNDSFRTAAAQHVQAGFGGEWLWTQHQKFQKPTQLLNSGFVRMDPLLSKAVLTNSDSSGQSLSSLTS